MSLGEQTNVYILGNNDIYNCNCREYYEDKIEKTQHNDFWHEVQSIILTSCDQFETKVIIVNKQDIGCLMEFIKSQKIILILHF